jgi:HSP20 family protein
MATSLMRRNPFGALDPVQSRMWDWFTTPGGFTPLSRLFGEVNSYVPPVDIYETREEVVVAASMPGLDVSKLDIQVLENQLTIAGEQNSCLCFEPEENATQHLQGIPRFGRFSFAFQLPCEVEADQTQARYENGLLCIRFLKAQKSRPVRVTIRPADASQIQDVTPAEAAPQQITAQAETEQTAPHARKSAKQAN